jgi:hypothetical protein
VGTGGSMRRSLLLKRTLHTPLDAVALCRDIVEGNYRAADLMVTASMVELMARIFTDFEELVANQPEGFLQGRDLGDESDVA